MPGAVVHLTIEDIVAKRRARWEEMHDPIYDAKITASAAAAILAYEDLRAQILERPYLLIECCFSVVDKQKRTVPFFLNEVQRDFIEQYEEHGRSLPYIILKGRQQGFTTLITAIQLSYSIVQKNFSGATLADCDSNTRAIFADKARIVLERLPLLLHPSERLNNSYELNFDKLNSSWRCSTATANVGRSRTLNFVHFSEAAFFSCPLGALQAAIGQAVTADALVIYESTANGFNDFKALWDSGSCVNLFYPWWRTSEYRSTEYAYLDRTDAWLSERLRVLADQGLDREQLAWYAKKYDSYLDKSMIRQEYPCSPEEAFVATGNSMFDVDLINTRLLSLGGVRPLRVGRFEYRSVGDPVTDETGRTVAVNWRLCDIQWVDDPAGLITIHEDPVTRAETRSGEEINLREPYSLGGDTAGSGEDYYTAKVVSNLDGRTMATLRIQRTDDDTYAEQVLCLARYYHDATVGIEVNYSFQPTRVIQRKYGYGNMYLRERYDRMTDKKEMLPGFLTSPATKPVIISELIRAMRDDPTRERDPGTLGEMLTFIRLDGGACGAMAGCHDDLVMALAIAYAVARSGRHDWIVEEAEQQDILAENFDLAEKESQDYWG